MCTSDAAVRALFLSGFEYEVPGVRASVDLAAVAISKEVRLPGPRIISVIEISLPELSAQENRHNGVRVAILMAFEFGAAV